ncbi:MAG: extracellular solute-binding protein [Bacillota bacterium]|nr:extracellular solute-binding protein [Bacillota bacterium]
MNKRITAWSVVFIGLILFLTGLIFAQNSSDSVDWIPVPEAITAYIRERNYQDYLAEYPDAVKPNAEIVIPAVWYSDTNMDLEVVSGLDGYPREALITGESGYVEWTFAVEQEGLYNIGVKYYPLPGRGVDIEREIWINGERPFNNAQYLKFCRVWGDEGPFVVDSLGNQIRARQVEKPMWIDGVVQDPVGYEQEPYLFYFKEGINTIRLVSQMEPMAIAEIKLYQKPPLPSYAEVRNWYEQQGYKPVEGISLRIEGQDSTVRSSPTLFPISDHGDPTVYPYHHAEIRLNSIGGYRWAQPGQWIRWEVNVPEAGLYKIVIKAKQDRKAGAFSTRRLYINGKVPFAEVSANPFYYSTYYQMNVIGDPETEEPYLFYFPAGKNEITLEVALGDVADVLSQTEEHLYELNTIYRRIIMITTGNPDPMRTYELDKRIPEVIEQIGRQASIYRSLVQQFVDETGMEGEHTQALTQISFILQRMYADTDRIPRLLSEFRDNLGSLGQWVAQMKEQPLQIDFLMVASPEQTMPRAEPTIWQSLLHEIKAIMASFYRNYDLVGQIGDVEDIDPDREPLTVWIGSGRDQAQILKQLIDNEFSPQTGIPVRLQLVPNLSQLLIQAAIAKTAPDVAIGLHTQDPVNFGLRGALYNLSQFDDFDEVMQDFMVSSYVPYTFRDNVWAVSAQQSFPVMFYRKDILAELGLNIPQTWDDVYQILPILQKNGMSVGIGSGIFYTWLYQRGELVYKPDGVETNLDSEVAIQTFTELTELFNLYSLMITFNSENRFRFGEMPIVIEDYGLYNRLAVFAPELRGEWGFALIPGTVQPDGTIKRTVFGGMSANPMSVSLAGIQGPATGILSTASDPEAAWEFVKWWISEPTQLQFGRELENLMGAAARYPTANLKAFAQLPWTAEQREILMEQWQWVEGSLEVPGGYYMSRMFDWAFRAVVVDGNFQSPRETLTKYNMDINYELRLKRQEFGLELELDQVPQEYIDLFWSWFTHIPRKDQY